MSRQKIVIVGGGTAGWITAAVLAKNLPTKHFDITLVESPDIKTVGVGEATIPDIVAMLRSLGIGEREFLSRTNGTYKYGIHFENWSEMGSHYMHAFGDMGCDYGNYSFYDLWLKCQSRLNLPTLNFFSPTATAAYKGKFQPANEDEASASQYDPTKELFYAYQFDAGLLVNVLQEYCTLRSVKHIQGKVTHIENGEFDYIQSITLEDGQIFEGNFFVDCSGLYGLLIKQHYQSDFQDWRHFLPCDAAVTLQTKQSDNPLPYTKSIALSSGWRWQIPLQNRKGNGYVYASQFISDSQALQELESELRNESIITDATFLKFKTGCLKEPWFKNCIAIGLSAGFFEPLESTSIHLIHIYAVHFKNALLQGTNVQQEADIFNKSFNDSARMIRDFLTMHYHITKRKDSPFWRHCQSMVIPKSLQQNLDEYAKSGKLRLNNKSIFAYVNWLQVLVGQNYLPNYEHLTDPNIDLEKAEQFFRQVNASIHQAVSNFPSHHEFLNQ